MITLITQSSIAQPLSQKGLKNLLEAADADRLVFASSKVFIAAGADKNLRYARALHPFAPGVVGRFRLWFRFLHI